MLQVLHNGGSTVLARLLSWPNKEEVSAPETKEQDERKTTPEVSHRRSALCLYVL